MNKDLHIPDCCGGGQPGDPAREPVYCSNTSRSWTREAWWKDREDSALQTSRAWKMSLKPRVQMSARETSAYSHSLHALNRIPASVQESRAQLTKTVLLLFQTCHMELSKGTLCAFDFSLTMCWQALCQLDTNQIQFWKKESQVRKRPTKPGCGEVSADG